MEERKQLTKLEAMKERLQPILSALRKTNQVITNAISIQVQVEKLRERLRKK